MTKKEIQQFARIATRMTQKEAIYAVLEAGHEFTVADARAAGIADPARVVNQLRELGYPVYLNPRKTRTGEVVKRYRLGTARKNG
jgi:hypothetical protein